MSAGLRPMATSTSLRESFSQNVSIPMAAPGYCAARPEREIFSWVVMSSASQG